MTNKSVPYLCGGIFFALLIESRNNTTIEVKGTRKSKKPIPQYIIMENLIRAINPEYCGYDDLNSFKKTVSDYRACKYHGGSIIPFERNTIKEEFGQSVREQYGEILERMKKFINISFPECNDKFAVLLIKRTLTLIRRDNNIQDDDLFFINEDGSPVSKKTILEKEKFNFISFLDNMK